MAQTNLNNLYPKPARDNANNLIAGISIIVGAAPTQLPVNAYTVPEFVDLVLIQAVADMSVTFDGSNPAVQGFLIEAGTTEFWSYARAMAARFSAAVQTNLNTSPFQL
jgi:hypothetical protein